MIVIILPINVSLSLFVFFPSSVPESLSYLRLQCLVSQSSTLLLVAMQHMLQILKTDIAHAQECGDREILLPLLHLFKVFLTMVTTIL